MKQNKYTPIMKGQNNPSWKHGFYSEYQKTYNYCIDCNKKIKCIKRSVIA
jgi:hypothetical protein